MLIIPFISFPLIVIYLFEKEEEVRKKYRYYESEINSLVEAIFDSNMVNEIDDSNRSKAEYWAKYLDYELRDSPKLLSGYFEHLFIGVFVGIPIGSILYMAVNFVV